MVKLNIKVHARDGIVYAQEVESVSSSNAKGVFDVMDMHTSFITLLTAPLIIKEVGGETVSIAAENGVMKVFNNEVNVYLGIKSG